MPWWRRKDRVESTEEPAAWDTMAAWDEEFLAQTGKEVWALLHPEEAAERRQMDLLNTRHRQQDMQDAYVQQLYQMQTGMINNSLRQQLNQQIWQSNPLGHLGQRGLHGLGWLLGSKY